MPAYITDPTVARASLLRGKQCFSWGSFNDLVPPTRAQVTQVALTSNVATLTVTLLEGAVPAVGALITVKGTQTSGGIFNVTNVPLTAVSINANGQGTVSFALTHANVSATPDAGQATIPQPIVGEALAASATAGLQFGITPRADGGQRGIGASAIVTGGPTAYTINIQVADVDIDAAYTTVGTISNTAPGSISLPNVSGAFVRAQQSGSGGTGPTVAVALWLE